MGWYGVDQVITFFDQLLIFILVVVLAISAIGFMSRSLAVGVFSGFMLFAYLALETNTALMTEFLYLIVFGILLYLGFSLSNYLLDGGTTP